MSKTRTFIAIAAVDEVPALARATVAELQGLTESVRWTEPDNFHWTLKFLGDVEDNLLFEICRTVARVTSQWRCFSVTADHVGAFPSLDRPRTLWLGAGEGSQPFCALQAALEDSLSDLGFRPEAKRFVPHLTLGRVGRHKHAGERMIERLQHHTACGPATMEVAEVVIYSSELERTGPSYQVVGRAPLVATS